MQYYELISVKFKTKPNTMCKIRNQLQLQVALSLKFRKLSLLHKKIQIPVGEQSTYFNFNTNPPVIIPKTKFKD